MTSDEARSAVAAQLRALGHDFVARDLNDEQLAMLSEHVDEMLAIVHNAELRTRVLSPGSLQTFKLAVPHEDSVEKHQLFSDSIVSGGSNPMGLGALLWREGDTSAMQVTLGKAFEGAPGRAHGGIVAALIDETMGLVLAIHDVLAFTVQLDVTYLAPTPIDKPIVARAWLEKRDGRKLSIRARVQSNDSDIASAKAVFVAVDPARFLEKIATLE
jgi:acyl-coenzyme A thioesterase PaaI-like protein